MQATEQQVSMAAQLYDMRDKARRLLGDKYKPHMAELGKILRMTADRDKKSIVAVATEVCKKRELIGMDMLMIMAAAVEIVEPTPNVKSNRRRSAAEGTQQRSCWASG